MPKPLTIPAVCDRFPPIVVRLLARRFRGRDSSTIVAITAAQISRLSGLPSTRVHHLSLKSSWDDVPVSEMLAFTKGCGADFDDRTWLRTSITIKTRLLARRIPRYLTKSPEWADTLQPLLALWLGE